MKQSLTNILFRSTMILPVFGSGGHLETVPIESATCKPAEYHHHKCTVIIIFIIIIIVQSMSNRFGFITQRKCSHVSRLARQRRSFNWDIQIFLWQKTVPINQWIKPVLIVGGPISEALVSGRINWKLPSPVGACGAASLYYLDYLDYLYYLD